MFVKSKDSDCQNDYIFDIVASVLRSLQYFEEKLPFLDGI